jgi:hypothetical protein
MLNDLAKALKALDGKKWPCRKVGSFSQTAQTLSRNIKSFSKQ